MTMAMLDLLLLPTCSSPDSLNDEYSSADCEYIERASTKSSPMRSQNANCIRHIILFLLFSQFIGLSLGQSHSTGKCYTFGPGMTIPGADYRRDVGLSRSECAVVCKTDACCLAFEWVQTAEGIGMCTLKSRSLNGTVTTVPKPADGGDLFFALCLDYDDNERDRIWDHEITGPVFTSRDNVDREKCVELCKSPPAGEEEDGQREPTLTAEKRIISHRNNNGLFNSRMTRSAAKHQNQAKPAIYNWRSDDPMDVDAKTGKCECISVLHSIRLSFGSFAGFLI